MADSDAPDVPDLLADHGGWPGLLTEDPYGRLKERLDPTGRGAYRGAFAPDGFSEPAC